MADSAEPARDSQTPPGWDDFVYDAFSTGAIGGSVVALFFLLIDALEGQPFFTPSLMGTVLFGSGAAVDASEIRMSMVAAYTAVHFLTFGMLGLGVAFAMREVELHARNPFGVLLGLFVLFEWGFFVAAMVFMPGLMDVLGAGRVAVANLLAAAGIGLFLVHEHRPELWQRWKALRA